MKTWSSSATALLLVPSLASAQLDVPVGAWESLVGRNCPSHHLEWISDGSYDEILGLYSQRLAPPIRQRVNSIVDYSHRCADETVGFSCEWATHLDAFRRVGLLDDFALWTCRNVTCEEAALCTYPTAEAQAR